MRNYSRSAIAAIRNAARRDNTKVVNIDENDIDDPKQLGSLADWRTVLGPERSRPSRRAHIR